MAGVFFCSGPGAIVCVSLFSELGSTLYKRGVAEGVGDSISSFAEWSSRLKFYNS